MECLVLRVHQLHRPENEFASISGSSCENGGPVASTIDCTVHCPSSSGPSSVQRDFHLQFASCEFLERHVGNTRGQCLQPSVHPMAAASLTVVCCGGGRLCTVTALELQEFY